MFARLIRSGAAAHSASDGSRMATTSSPPRPRPDDHRRDVRARSRTREICRCRCRTHGFHGVGPVQSHALCLFVEMIYFARPDSRIKWSPPSISAARRWAPSSRLQAKLLPMPTPWISMPDSATLAAIGYAPGNPHPWSVDQESLHRSHLHPARSARLRDRRPTWSTVPPEIVEGSQRVVLVDDTIVRGTTSRPIMNLIRQAGAKEVHMRVHAPHDVAVLPWAWSAWRRRTHRGTDDRAGDRCRVHRGGQHWLPRWKASSRRLGVDRADSAPAARPGTIRFPSFPRSTSWRWNTSSPAARPHRRCPAHVPAQAETGYLHAQ